MQPRYAIMSRGVEDREGRGNMIMACEGRRKRKSKRKGGFEKEKIRIKELICYSCTMLWVAFGVANCQSAPQDGGFVIYQVIV